MYTFALHHSVQYVRNSLDCPYSAITQYTVNIKWLKFALAPLNTSFAETF